MLAREQRYRVVDGISYFPDLDEPVRIRNTEPRTSLTYGLLFFLAMMGSIVIGFMVG